LTHDWRQEGETNRETEVAFDWLLTGCHIALARVSKNKENHVRAASHDTTNVELFHEGARESLPQLSLFAPIYSTPPGVGIEWIIFLGKFVRD
jgi:hypothetical protein